jgi:ABC-2 type transport system permease protein
VIMFFGELLDLPQWFQDISPFEHVPLAPAVGVDAVPLAALTLVAFGLAAIGAVGFRHRDIQ